MNFHFQNHWECKKNNFDLVLDVERQKEEMAWQMAAIIVSDVTSRAEPDKPETET